MRPLKDLVLDRIQADFPLAPDPYGVLAADLHAAPGAVRAALAELRASGVVRRVGASFSSRHLGYTSTLCALAVPPERDCDEVARIVSACPNVTHNYLRPHRYNLWFTLIARGRGEVDALMRRIVRATGCPDALELPALALYKIRVDFSQMEGGGSRRERPARAASGASPSSRPAAAAKRPFDADDPFDRALVRWAQGDIAAPAADDPFAQGAALLQAELGRPVAEQEVIARLAAWRDAGVVRRFGAMVRHQRLGYAFNGMTVWDVPDERADEAGRLLARDRRVSHCYRRVRAASWPHNLYTMVHALDRDALDEGVAALRLTLAGAGIEAPEPLVLVSTKECKKVSMSYFVEEGEGNSFALAGGGERAASPAPAPNADCAARTPAFSAAPSPAGAA